MLEIQHFIWTIIKKINVFNTLVYFMQWFYVSGYHENVFNYIFNEILQIKWYIYWYIL